MSAEHWHGELIVHANALARLGVISEEDLREMLQLADAAFGHVIEEKEAAWFSGIQTGLKQQ
ncbi:MAG: hypothetical protein JWP42_2426 [Pseudomonas sp.]|nr:hypothetical protein [Pseudomonas sp.]